MRALRSDVGGWIGSEWPVSWPARCNVISLSQEILRTDVSGMPLEWIDYRDAVRLYHTEQVAYACGTPL